MSKVSVSLIIPRIGGVITIWDKLFFKIRVSFDELVIIIKVLLEPNHGIETHIDVVLEVHEVHISVAF